MATIQRFERGDGTAYYRARLRLADGARPWCDIPEKHGRTEEEARKYADRLQALEDEHGELVAARRERAAALVPKEAETSDDWYGRYHAYQRELGAPPRRIRSARGVRGSRRTSDRSRSPA